MNHSNIHTTDKSYSPPYTIAFWEGYWTTLRPYLFFVSGAAGLTGLALAPDLSWFSLMAAFIAFFFTYGLGQALTDTFQMDTDSISAPYRPLVRKKIARSHVFAVSIAGLTLCSAVFIYLNPVNILLCGLAVIGLIAYTWFKRRWWGGPFWNAWIVAVLPSIGYLCGGESLTTAFTDPLLIATMVSIFFSYAVFVLLGYFKDISADRETGYRTLPVVMGWRFSVWVSVSFALAALAAGIWILFHLGIPQGTGLYKISAYGGGLLWLTGIVMLFWAHRLMMKLSSEEQAYRAIGPSVKGFVLIHLGLATVFKPVLLPIVLLLYVLFEAALYIRPDNKQI